VIGEIGFPGHERVASVVTLTVLMSVFAHGLTAVPFVRAYGNHTGAAS
jgi:NhaP-type Na+/H+ or K+/H+ antiporter